MPFTEGQIYQSTSGGAPEPNFYAFKNGQLQYIKDLGDQYTQQRGNQSGFDFAPTFRNQLSQQFGTPIQTVEANEVGDYASALRAQGRIAFQNPISSSDLKTLLASPFSQTQAPINPESRLSGQTNLPAQQFSGGKFIGNLTPEQKAQNPQLAANLDQNPVPVQAGASPQPTRPLASLVSPQTAQSTPIQQNASPGASGGGVFVKNNATGQFAQVDQFGHLKGFGTPQEFAAAGGDYNKAIGLDAGSFDRVSKGQAYIDPTTGKLNDPGMQNSLASNASGIDRGAANPANGPKDFIQTYGDIINQLGLPNIKVEFEKVQAELKALNTEKAEKILNIQNDPWMTQGVKDRNMMQINRGYEAREKILTNKGIIFDTLYKEGQQQAQFLATHEYAQQRDAAMLAEKKAEAAAKLEQIKPSNFRNIDGGLYDLEKGEWIIQPRTRGPSSAHEIARLDSFSKDLSNYNAGAGTREQLIQKLQAKYPDIDPNDITRKVYETYPDKAAPSSNSSSFFNSIRNYLLGPSSAIGSGANAIG